ncbi:alpha/beta hydrolase [Humibacter ginsenosidimutans]|uniref:Alpha/beta hydrolase n=1 Tax=Humibacter ginsenosidimutans TaxID=2599293 RepID=A0A5B8M8X9_9MICO|nr:alpha/beta hydrolase [Humibacter ginsenosidimutans]QDZ16082.1 alpha/beta hydrolase [Humibacter ginsenosidimutans]
MGEWAPDVLGRPFEQRTLRLGAESVGVASVDAAPVDPTSGRVPRRGTPSSANAHARTLVATVVRYRRRPRVALALPARGYDVLYVHGWSDYFFQKELAEFWWRQGARFHALDLRRYGRSLRPGQTPGFISDLQTYDQDIAAALGAMGHTPTAGGHPRRRLILMGHSTGGLTLSLWAARHRGVASALVLNSPWLEFQTGSFGRDMLRPLIDLHARVAPRGRMPSVDFGFYSRSVSAAEQGEWTYNPDWRPERGFALHPAWLRAVLEGHRRVANGLNLDLPVFTMLSARSTISPVWSDAMLRTDTVLDVDEIAARATQLGSRVTVQRFDGALHDIVLSAPPVRAEAYEAMARWLRYALG